MMQRQDEMTMGARQIWETSLGQLQLMMPRPSYDTWLKGTTGLTLEDELLSVGVPTPFAAEWLERRMYQLIRRTVTEVTTRPLQVRFQVVSLEQLASPGRGNESEPKTLQEPLLNSAGHQPSANGTHRNGTFNPRYTFQNFVTGKSNQLAHAAACAVAEHPGEQYNPLFIYSGVGLGKTHLLHAIASAAAQRNLTPLYVTTEQFTNDFIQAIRERKTEDFRARYRSADMLLLDDIQFLAGKEQTQESFFHTFNDLHNASRQIVVTCDRPPKAVAHLEDRLRSRFEWGLIADMQPPDLETRLAILRDKAQALCPALPDAVAQVIVQRSHHSVRELEGCLNRVIALAQFTGEALSADLAARALADSAPHIPPTQALPQTAIARIADHYHLAPEALCIRPHDRKTTHPQRVAMYILDTSLSLPLQDIAHLLGQWHRKTVANAVAQITTLLTKDATFQQEIQDILHLTARPGS